MIRIKHDQREHRPLVAQEPAADDLALAQAGDLALLEAALVARRPALRPAGAVGSCGCWISVIVGPQFRSGCEGRAPRRAGRPAGWRRRRRWRSTTKNAITGFGSSDVQPVAEHAAHGVPLEHRLGDHGAAEDAADVDGHDGGQRDHRVAEPVAHDHRALRQTFGPRRADVVLVEHLEHARPRVARVGRQRDQHQRHRRQDRWLNVSLVMTQKLPSSRGSRSPMVLIGRLRMTELDEYSAHDCIARSTKITTARPKRGDGGGARADSPLSYPPKA